MYKISELAMPKSHKVTTICFGKKKVWSDREEAKDFFLEAMMSSEGEEYDRFSAIYIQIINGLSYCTD
ncbi:MAG: hypothetical protein ACI4I9_03235 [Porcipelethomonas sp.]